MVKNGNVWAVSRIFLLQKIDLGIPQQCYPVAVKGPSVATEGTSVQSLSGKRQSLYGNCYWGLILQTEFSSYENSQSIVNIETKVITGYPNAKYP